MLFLVRVLRDFLYVLRFCSPQKPTLQVPIRLSCTSAVNEFLNLLALHGQKKFNITFSKSPVLHRTCPKIMRFDLMDSM